MFETGRWRIFRGDEVFINNGPHANMSGKVLEVIKDKRVPQVLVEGVNLVSNSCFSCFCAEVVICLAGTHLLSLHVLFL